MSTQLKNEKKVLRTPRLVPQYPEGQLMLEDPARPTDKPVIQWLNILLPPLAMTTISIFTAILTKSYIILLSAIGMTAITIMISIMNYNSSVKQHREQNKKLEKKYLDYLFNVRAQLEDASNQQREAISYVHGSVSDCTDIVREQKKQLWERTGIESDFMYVRVGTGVQPIALLPVFESKSKAVDDENKMEKIAEKICEEMYFVRDIPVKIPMQEISTLGVFGKKAEVREFINAIITHSTTHHGYDDVRVVGLIREEELEHWEWLKWLPHTWDKDRKQRYIATNSYDALKLANELLPELAKRESEKKGSYGQRQIQLPHYIFLVFAPELWESSDIMKYVVANNEALGITSIFTTERIDVELPLNCQIIIEVKENRGILRKDSINRLDESTHQFITDSMNVQSAEIFSRLMSPLRLNEAQDSRLIPTMVTFLDSFDVKRVEELTILNRWYENQVNRTLSVPLGRGAASQTLFFDMHEKSYGPHGLVAGTTGSGKSELLQSLLLALAVNYHPHEVAFVLIDYKGGGMANAFQGLPHLVGTITNLGGNQINRALASIKSELMRRQRMFSDAGVTNIDDYIVLYRSKSVPAPLPHLIIVVDEFAELKSDQPEFMKELVSAARVGRSLGIHLILATQKPSGVVDDQIWSNSRFKLCLKVQTPSDSSEMLKRPDAAEIKEKGRGYLQVGNNEIFTLFQSSWSGAPYIVESSTEEKIPPIHVVALNGGRTQLIPTEKKEDSVKHPTQLQAVVNHIAQEAQKQGIKEAFQLWLPPLPEQLHLDELIPAGMGWNGDSWNRTEDFLVAPIGLIDNPSQQAQYQLQIDFAKEGHLVVYGAPSSGKTTMLRTIITSLATKYDPDQVNFYILDFGSRTLGVFHELPHLGDVIYSEEEEKLAKLFSWILDELEDRKRKFSKMGISNLVSYRSASKEEVPGIVLLLDNYTGFAEMYEDRVADINKIVREGGNYGIYIVATANSINTIPYRITQNIKQSLVLQMADPSDYSSIVGRTEGLEPAKVVGRGLVKEQSPLEFHTALPVDGYSDDQIAEGIRALSGQMKKVWGTDSKPKVFNAVPKQLSIQEVLDKSSSEQIDADDTQPRFPIALDWETAMPVQLDVRDTSCLLISHEESISIESLMHPMIQSISYSLQKHRVKITIFDSSAEQQSFHLPEDANVEVVTTEEQFLQLTQSIIDDLQQRKNASREAYALSENPEIYDENTFILENYPLLIVCIPHLRSAFDLMEEESLQHLERIARFGKGLGIMLVFASEIHELNRLQLISALISAIKESQCMLLVGGRPGQHDIAASSLERMDPVHRNKVFRDGEALLIQAGASTRVKLASE